MRETEFQTLFSKWLARQKRPNTSCAYELKVTKTDSLPFSAVKEHQLRNLLLANKRLVHKIADVGVLPKPFDCFLLAHAQSYVVIMYYQKGCREFYMIKASVFDEEMKTSPRKSLTESRAAIIGIKHSLDE